MAITFVADTEQGFGASTVTVTAPAGIQNGDTLVLILSHGYPLNVASYNSPIWIPVLNFQNQGSTYIFTKPALATDTTWAFTFTNTFAGTAWCGAYRGGWVHGAGGAVSGHILTTASVNKCALITGTRIDAMMSRRDSGGACVHADPGWATRRAYIDGISGAAHWELSVADRPVSGWTYASDNWTMTLPPSHTAYQHHQLVVSLVDSPQPVDFYSDVAMGADTAMQQGWVYKGRLLSTDDTPEVP